MFPFNDRSRSQSILKDENARDHAVRRRARRPGWVSLLVLLLTASVLAAGFPPSGGAGVARADTAFPPPDLLNLTLLDTCNSRVQIGVANSALYCATPAQIQSLQSLEQAAVAQTIRDHGLSPSDTAAVESWGRNEALGALWALLGQAIQTPACSTGQTPCRTTDQQNAVDWLTAVFKRQAVQAADDAGLEYVKWAGLDQTAYQNLLAGNPSLSQLQTFLSGTPINYNNGGSFTNPGASTGGYCVYQSPSPYQSEYTANIFTNNSPDVDSDCFAPCSDPFSNCAPATPSYDQFVKWGQADVNNQIYNSNDIALSAFRIAAGVIGTAATLGAAGLGAALYTSSAFVIETVTTTYTSWLTSLQAVDGVAVEFEATSVEVVSVSLSAAAVAAIAAIVIAAIAIAVTEGISVVTAAAVPGKLASLIANAPGSTPDLNAVLNDSSQASGLFDLFVGATLPNPRFATCDNSQTLVGASIPAPCLNPTPIPAATSSDPNFKIQAKDSTTSVDATSLNWKDSVANANDSARVHGNWFINQVTLPDGITSTVQALHMHYTDWSGAGQTALLVNDPTNGYQFLTYPDSGPASGSFSPATCVKDKTCSYSPSIQYVGPDGKDYTATVAPPALPVVAPTTSANPLEGSPVQFAANGSSPDSSVSLTYQWQFEQPFGSSSLSCTWDPTSASFNCSSNAFTAPVSGSTASYTWSTTGTYHVKLTVTDSLGRSTVDTFTVNVGDVAPTVAISPGGPSGPGCASATTTAQSHCSQVGLVTNLSGTVTHAGSADTETVKIDWGDGSSNAGTSGVDPGLIYVNNDNVSVGRPSDTQVTFSSAHTYSNPGHYTVTVSASDQAGGKVSTTTAETIWGIATLAWTAPAAITYGTPLSATQLNATATYNGSSVPGTFAYYDYFGNFGLTATHIAAGQVLQAGQHPLLAYFTPTDPDVFHQLIFPGGPRATLSVNQAPLTVTAGNQVMLHGGTLPSFTAGAPGLVNGDSLASIGVSCTSVDRNGHAISASTPVGGYLITCGGSPANYSPTFKPGALFITQRAVSLTDAATDGGGSVSLGGSSGSAGSVALATSGGTGTVAIGRFGGNPGPIDPYATTNAYFGAFLNPGGSATGAQITDCNLNGGNLLYWLSSTGWMPASQQSYNAATQCVTVTVSGTTSPSLQDLNNGAFFGVLKDFTPPVITYSGNAGTYTVDQAVNITCKATDPAEANGAGSGVASTTCQDVHAPAYTFSLGSHTFSAQAVDRAGNMGSGQTTFLVQVTFTSLCNLTQQFVSTKNMATLPCATLAAAARAKGSSQQNLLHAYQHQVEAEIGHGLTQTQATTLENLSMAL